MRTSRSFAALIVLSLFACSPLLPEWRREVGDIGTHALVPAPLRLPPTARRGEVFTATVTTYGSSSCTREDGTEVRVAGLTAEITPYDRKRTGGVCTTDLAAFPREVTLRFDQTGEATVWVLGRQGARHQATLQVQP